MEYILFIHNNTTTSASQKDWDEFFIAAKETGMFQGGSEIGKRIQLGPQKVSDTTKSLVGFMRFESSSLEELKNLLEIHPVLIHGGTLELCEMPKTKS